MTSLIVSTHKQFRTQYKEVRDALLILKTRYKARKEENAILKRQVRAFQKLVSQKCILVSEAEKEITRLEEVLWHYRDAKDAKERQEA
jgi:TPP-dependent trihydroxycyclohexane-1,2-dione (THcHDO) dehydratase